MPSLPGFSRTAACGMVVGGVTCERQSALRATIRVSTPLHIRLQSNRGVIPQVPGPRLIDNRLRSAADRQSPHTDYLVVPTIVRDIFRRSSWVWQDRVTLAER